MGKSNRTTQALLKSYVGQAGNFSTAGNRYLRLWTAQPTDAGTGGTEVSGGGYSAFECSTYFPTVGSTDRSIANDTAIVMSTSVTASWGEVVAWSLSSAATGTSSFYVIEALDNTVTISTGTDPTFGIGSLVLSEDD